MKHTKLNVLYFLIILLLAFSCNPRGNEKETPFDCGQMIDFEKRLETDQVFKASLEKLENQTLDYINRLKRTNFSDFRSTVVTIPVVVHVVYKNATENITDAKIQSQIDALNNFYRKMNADVSTVPAPFNSLAADVMIQFVLAKRDPNCLPTTGITRTSTVVANFNTVPLGATPQDRNAVKFNTSGGADGWPSDQYLNLWSCDLVGGLIGYAAFPSDMATRPAEDGVVMDFMSFGTIAPLNVGLDLGRVCGHEVGHWLNLRHIWGDESACTGTDFVDDTPNQGPNNSGCPTFPHTDACSPSSPGVMFMNNMDYTLDACRRLFTLGQNDRMAATLFTIRSSLLSSQGALAPPSTPTVDLWMKDTDEDLGNEPNNESTTFYISDDIWARNSNDGLINQESQNPLGGSTNYVYVRVRNRGCLPTSAGAVVKLYWAKASAGLSWPQPWDGSVILTGTTLMGNIISSQPIASIPGNGFNIFVFTWNNTPDPSDYASLGADLQHFCLLARIEEPAGMTFPEVPGDLGGNVKKNNNIVWKNIGINDIDGAGFASTLISNYSKEQKSFKINIDGQKFNREMNKFKPQPGMLYANFDKELNELIESKKVTVTGLQKTNDGLYLLESGTAVITGLKTNPAKHHVVQLKFVPNKEFAFQRYVYQVDVTQIDEKTGGTIGGQLFKFKYNRERNK